MQYALVIAISVHVLAAVFWAGSTFALARTGAIAAERLFGPQMGAAGVAVLSGGYLWHILLSEATGTMPQVLGIGAACALIALAVQALVAGRALRSLRRKPEVSGAQSRIVLAHRIAAILLAITTLSMVTARYI